MLVKFASILYVIVSRVSSSADGYSIYVKSLPLSATPAQLEEEFKKFGPIKPGGIQVRSHKVFIFTVPISFLCEQTSYNFSALPLFSSLSTRFNDFLYKCSCKDFVLVLCNLNWLALYKVH